MRNWRVVLPAVSVAVPMVLGDHLRAWHGAPQTDDNLEVSPATLGVLVFFIILVGAYAGVASIVGGVALIWRKIRAQDIGRGIFIGLGCGTVLGIAACTATVELFWP